MVSGGQVKSSIPLIRVNQWLRSWEMAEYSERNLPKPADHFFLGSVPISELRRLA